MDAAGLRTVGAVLSCAFVVAADLEPLHRYTSAEYHRLIESGGMPDARVELIDGLLVDMSPKTRAHERALRFLLSWLAARLDLGRYELAVAAPLSLADGTEPEPDLAVIAPGTPAPYHPASAALVIEVAVSSGRRDLLVKAPKYAAAGVPVYLVCDLDARRVVEHTEPTGDGYQAVREVRQLDPRLPGVAPLAAGELFAAAFA